MDRGSREVDPRPRVSWQTIFKSGLQQQGEAILKEDYAKPELVHLGNIVAMTFNSMGWTCSPPDRNGLHDDSSSED